MTYTRPAILALIIANLVPLLGVFAYGWNLYTLVMVYWSENILIGVFTLVKMAFVKKVGPVGKTKLYKTLLFCAVYGTFVVIHGSILSQLVFRSADRAFNFGIVFVLCILAFLLSHAVSMTTNFLMKRENEKISAFDLMFLPFVRVAPMHLVLLLAAIVVLAMVEGPGWRLSLFVLLKVFLDLASHFAEHTAMARR